MRIALLVVASALVVGCSTDTGELARSGSALTTPSGSTSTTAASTRATAPVPAPAPGAAIADVIAWIAAATPADPRGFREMTRDGVSTPLGDQVAFTTADANCVTNRYREGALACLVELSAPPPRPPDFPTAWKDDWVDFDGTVVDVGSGHGDPGPFADGTGAELPDGRSLAFGDYQCRADPSGLFCVHDAHQTAIRLSARGVEPFGCLREVLPPPVDIGIRFSC